MYDTLLTNPIANSSSGSSTTPAYFVASRCVSYVNGGAYFQVFGISNGEVRNWSFWNTNGDTISGIQNSIRPMIEVDLSKVTIGITGSGTASSPYSMVKK